LIAAPGSVSITVQNPGGAVSNAVTFTINGSGSPVLAVNRTRLNYGYSGALITDPQTVEVTITGGTNVGWIASPNITVSPSSGIGSATFQVTANPGSSGTVTVTAPGAVGSPQQITVNVANVTPTLPFGSFDTPANNTMGISGAVGVTGWALDNIEVTGVGIWRNPVPTEPTASNGLVFIGNANFVADARPDVAATFPSSPYQYRGGWGYLMLTNFLPNSAGSGPLGNGTYTLHAIVTNKAGQTLDLGTRTITVDNAHATQPFGTIDTPDQGGNASGNSFVNFGWALTPQPCVIPFDGSTITVYLDSTPAGHPTYNQFRSDIATLFPGHANSNGAVGFFYIDTTKMTNAVHTISWSVTDNCGHVAGIGSRYFNVLNVNGGVAAPEEPPANESFATSVRLRSGYELNAPEVLLVADTAGSYLVKMEQLGRIEISLGAAKGYMIIGGQREALPLGSSLKEGVFYWNAPLGFLGEYQLLFERPGAESVSLRVLIQPKSYFRGDALQ
jgi:hypothetical protein